MIHLARIVSIKGKCLAFEVHLLQLVLLFPAAVFHRQIHVGTVAAAGIGKDPRGGISQAGALRFGLLLGMGTNEVLIQGLIGLSGHLHALIDQSHLVDEEIAEHTRAVHHHINAGTAQFLQGN